MINLVPLVTAQAVAFWVLAPIAVIGALGMTLGDLGVNIANFTLGRSAQGNDAIAILYLDEPIGDEALAALQNTGKFLQARRLRFEV